MVSDINEEDWTKFSTFRDGDPKNITYLEYARLVSHRTNLILEELIHNIDFDKPEEESDDKGKKKAFQVMKKAVEELNIGYSLLNHESEDYLGYFDQSEKKIRTIETKK